MTRKDLRQSPAWANYLACIGWQVENVNNTFVYIKKFPILGNFVKLQRSNILNQKIINSIESKYHPFYFSIEPLKIIDLKLIENCKLKIVNSPSLPTKTLIINLQKSENELLKSFSQKTRYNIKLSEKKNVQIEISSDVFAFTKFWHQNFERKRFPFFSQQKNIIAMQKSFGKNSKILLAKKEGKTIAVLLLLFYDHVSYYLYAASSNEGRKNFAPTLLTWEGILLSKKLGCKVFDFDGIYDARFPIKSWAGFTKFKSGFSKNEIEYPRMFVKTKSWFKI